MREVEAEAPVVWPAWCYSGSGGGDQSGPGINQGGGGQGVRQRAGRRRAPPGPPAVVHNGAHGESPNHNNNTINNNTLHGPIKNERLSPQNATERSSSRSRSVTPSTGSFPGTPPQTGPGSSDRGASPAHSHTAMLGTHAPPPQQTHALARNYSDFMRSLAAKYNNANSTEFFNAARPTVPNGFPPTMDQKFGLKTPPFVGLLGPPQGVSVPYRSPPPSGEVRERPVGGLFAGYSYAQGGPRSVPAFPSMLDMSSTKALLTIARVANVAKEAEMSSNYIKSATKRPPGSDGVPISSPLDLSFSAGANIFAPSSAKKSRLTVKNEHQNESGSSSGSSASCGESGDASPGIDLKQESIKNESRNGSFLKSQRLSGGREGSGTTSPASFGRRSPGSSGRKSPGSMGRKSPSSRDFGGCCRSDGRRECVSADPEIASWTVDDVCKFVESIDICAEYSPMFREQRIDGSGLPLLTEDHLTGLLKMKLGPALKMKAMLAGRLGSNCRCSPTTPTPVPVTSPSPATTPNTDKSFKVERPPSVDSDNS